MIEGDDKMKKAWSKERAWECSKAESIFEELLKKRGFAIEGYKEYQTKTEYKIVKDGIEAVWSFPHESGVTGLDVFNSFIYYYNMLLKYNRIKPVFVKGEA